MPITSFGTCVRGLVCVGDRAFYDFQSAARIRGRLETQYDRTQKHKLTSFCTGALCQVKMVNWNADNDRHLLLLALKV